MSLKADKVLYFSENFFFLIYSEIFYVDIFVGDAEWYER